MSAEGKTPLRERRRKQTARDIQRATLRLAREEGLDAVTTERIARAAGVSPRTFFNYFPNKEAAVIGTPVPLPDAALAAVRGGSGPPGPDMRALAAAHLRNLEDELEVIRGLDALKTRDARVRQLFDEAMGRYAEEVEGALAARAPGMSPGARMMAAELALRCMGVSLMAWAAGDTTRPEAALDTAWANLRAGAEALLGD
ncbi:TetR family transcriptional regulator [Rhodovulum sp. DZ06]|uniref:TetR family transcriptional regulator n=1 Tax=Rhodovulum sp. DZ06 TaxID=3425126 RepID=UPI003D33D1B7